MNEIPRFSDGGKGEDETAKSRVGRGGLVEEGA
jgi:hypothetical protein